MLTPIDRTLASRSSDEKTDPEWELYQQRYDRRIHDTEAFTYKKQVALGC